MPHIHELYDFTTSAFVIHPREKKLLLLFHTKLQKWLQPGGHVELNENPLQALHHELEEETGLTPNDYVIIEPAESPNVSGENTKLPLPFYFNEHPMGNKPSHKHIDICYLAKSTTDKLTENPDGATKIGWFFEYEIKDLYRKGDMFKDTLEICEWIFDKHL